MVSTPPNDLPRDGNNVHIQMGAGQTSILNSSTTALNNAAVFTGTWEYVGGYDSVVVSIATDKSGLYSIQFSPDGINIDSTLTRYHKDGEIHVPHRFTITRNYYRVVYTNNSGENQTYFRLQSIYGSKQQLNAPLDGILAQDFDATVVRPTDTYDEIALGLRQGVTSWNKLGYNTDVDIASVPIWPVDTAYTFLSTASTLTLVSSDNNDKTGDTGARSVVIYGVDGNREAATQIVSLNGTTNVVTTSTWLGINRVAVASAGSSSINEGNITITATTGGSTQAYIPTGQGVTQQLLYFNPINSKSLLRYLHLNADKATGGGNPRVTFYCYAYSPISNTRYELFREIMDTGTSSQLDITFPIPFGLTEGDIFWVEAVSSANDTSVSGRFSLQTYLNVDA